MSNSRYTIAGIVLSTFFASSLASATSVQEGTYWVHYGVPIGYVGGPDTRPCYRFTLSGVTVADSAVPGVPWFGIPFSKNGYKETVSTLLAAKAMGKTVHIATTGMMDTDCGHVGIQSVVIEP